MANTAEALSLVKADPAAREIVEEARRAHPALRSAVTPAGSEAVYDAMRWIAVDRPTKGKSKEHWAIHKEMYAASLEGFPAAAIWEGARGVIEDADIYGFPNVAQFLAKVRPAAERIHREEYRMRKIAEVVIDTPKEPVPPEMMAKLSEEVATVRRALKMPMPDKTNPEERRRALVAMLRELEAKEKTGADAT